MKRARTSRQWQVTRKAALDLLEIGRYTENMWGRTQRRRYLALLEKSFNVLLKKPNAGTDFGYVRPGYRRMSAGEHYIFYIPAKNRMIMIVRIIHQKRDVIRHLIEDEQGNL